MTNNKDKYQVFCERTFVPIYSKPWWLDAICGPENWDVWLFERDGVIQAAMPYYFEDRQGLKYITKAPLTQNNGIIFRYAKDSKPVARAIFEEKVIDSACEYIASLNLDVYEQQYQTSFGNWLPFFWNRYTAITRYTYRMEDTSDLNIIWDGISSKRRSVIKKGQRNSNFYDRIDDDLFWKEHEKIYLRQGLQCPFSYELWIRLSSACRLHDAGKISSRITNSGEIAAVSFVVWDENAVYKLMGGPIPEYAGLDAYSALTWDEICFASKMGRSFDFEGAVIKRISTSYREYGGEPKAYFRIRKVFNPTVIRDEAEQQIAQLK